LSKEEWLVSVAKNAEWITNSKSIRNTLGYTGDQGKEKKVQKKEIAEMKKQEKERKK